MNLLGLDTSTPLAAVGLLLADGTAFAAPPDPGLRHGRGLLPSVRDLLRRAGLAVRDLDAVAVGLGPGSYTGLRVGITAAKTLAYAIGCPLVGLDSLEVLAANAPAGSRRLAVVADAQRGDLYSADFDASSTDSRPARLGPTLVEPIAAWLARLDPETTVLGPALDRPGSFLPPGFAVVDPSFNHPDGLALLRLARLAFEAGERIDPWTVEPVYLRRSAAEDQWERNRPR